MKIRKIVDLSWPITNDTPIYPGDPIVRVSLFSTIESLGYNLSSLELGTQTGTHVDAPYHLNHDTETIDRMPLSQFFGEAVMIDVSFLGELEQITVPHISPYEPMLKGRRIVMFKTGWDKYVRTEKYLRHPYLSVSACEYLLDLGVNLLCVDTLNLDMTYGAVKFPVHELCAIRTAIIAENMCNFGAVDFDNPIISVFPLNIVGCDGSPVRAVAIDYDFGG